MMSSSISDDIIDGWVALPGLVVTQRCCQHIAATAGSSGDDLDGLFISNSFTLLVRLDTVVIADSAQGCETDTTAKGE